MKKQADQRDTKQLLLDISEQLFAKKDFDRVSVDEICREAGVTKGAFYHYFSSKYDIPLHQYRNIQNAFYKNYEKNLLSDTLDRFISAILWYADYCTEDKINLFTNYYRVMINYDKNRILRKIEIETRVFREILAVGTSDGTFRSDIKIEFYAEMITRFIASLLLDWTIFKGAINLKRELDFLMANMLEVLCPDTEPE